MIAGDLFYFNACNLDSLTETFSIAYYMHYLSKWPEVCRVIEDHDAQIEGYSVYGDFKHIGLSSVRISSITTSSSHDISNQRARPHPLLR